MFSEIPCLFCFSKATNSEEYTDEVVKQEAERMYKFLCSLLGVKLDRNEDIFHVLCDKYFLPLCKSCSLLFRNVSELAAKCDQDTRRSIRVSSVIQDRLKTVADEIGDIVQKSEEDGSSASWLEFVEQLIGISGSDSAKEATNFLKAMQKFRLSVVQQRMQSKHGSGITASTISVSESALSPGVHVKQKLTEITMMEDSFWVHDTDKNSGSNQESLFAKSMCKDKATVTFETIVEIKQEKDDAKLPIEDGDDESLITDNSSENYDDTDFNPRDDEWEEEGSDAYLTDSESENDINETEDPNWGEPHLSSSDSETKEDEECNPIKKKNYRNQNIHADSKTITKSGGFSCDRCNVAFAYEINLKRHIEKYHSGPIVKAYHKIAAKPSNKSRPFSAKPIAKHAVSANLPIVNKNKNLEKTKCDQCDGEFSTPSSARRHSLRYHSGVKSGKRSLGQSKIPRTSDRTQKQDFEGSNISKHFKCPYCKDTFSFKGNMKKHVVRRHSGLKKNNSNKVNKTVRLPQAVISIKCGHCSTIFTNEVNLKRHIRRIRLEKSKESLMNKKVTKPKRVCRICHEEFLDASNLNRHIKAVHFECRLFQCQECKRTFNRSDNLKTHQKRYHSLHL